MNHPGWGGTPCAGYNSVVGSMDRPKKTAGRAGKPTDSLPPVNEVADALKDAASEAMKSAFFDKRPYLKYAFANPYNLSLFLGGLAASVVTLNPVLALATLGVEAIWLLHAPDSSRLRKLLWDPRFEKLRHTLERQERAQRMSGMSDEDRERVEALVDTQQGIISLGEQNPSFTGDLLRGQLVKTQRLVDSFLEMAKTCDRYEKYLRSVDVDDLEEERARWQGRVQARQLSEQEREIAKKNLAVILKRTDKLREIRNYLSVARGQLDLIENSFELIADQIVTMQSPAELSGQLDDLLGGVESVQQTARDTEKMLKALEL